MEEPCYVQERSGSKDDQSFEGKTVLAGGMEQQRCPSEFGVVLDQRVSLADQSSASCARGAVMSTSRTSRGCGRGRG